MFENSFLIDWFTLVFLDPDISPEFVISYFGLSGVKFKEEQKFRNGYPLHLTYPGITLSFGADNPSFYSDPSKLRLDMGVCINFSGQGCRAFETYSSISWNSLFDSLFSTSAPSWHLTRLDLAFDDHTGILDIHRIESDTRNRFYISKSTKSEIIWSDDQDTDIQGLSVFIGSPSSDVRIRIYDKAAERGFTDRHWIRVELQLRRDRATSALAEFYKSGNLGQTVSGILINYLTFREESFDTNKSRWPIADYWLSMLTFMDRISLFISPGEPYNLRKTEDHIVNQYGAAIVTISALHDPWYLLDRCKARFPERYLPKKYSQILNSSELPFSVVLSPDPDLPFSDDFENCSLEGF